jgi:hypothetical protein
VRTAGTNRVKEWQYYRATKGETSSEVDDNVQTVDTPFQEMNRESMAYWLGKFLQEVVRRDGQEYPPRSLLRYSHRFEAVS